MLTSGDAVISTLESMRGNDQIQQLMATFHSLDITHTLTDTISTLGGLLHWNILLLPTSQTHRFFDYCLLADVPQVLQTVESLTDAAARQKLIDDWKDTILSFLLDFIPTLSIPDVDG